MEAPVRAGTLLAFVVVAIAACGHESSRPADPAIASSPAARADLHPLPAGWLDAGTPSTSFGVERMNMTGPGHG